MPADSVGGQVWSRILSLYHRAWVDDHIVEAPMSECEMGAQNHRPRDEAGAIVCADWAEVESAAENNGPRANELGSSPLASETAEQAEDEQSEGIENQKCALWCDRPAVNDYGMLTIDGHHQAKPTTAQPEGNMPVQRLNHRWSGIHPNHHRRQRDRHEPHGSLVQHFDGHDARWDSGLHL